MKHLICIVAILIVGCIAMRTGRADDLPAIPDVPRTNENQEATTTWNSVIESRANARYWSEMAERAKRQESNTKLVTVVCGVLGIALALAPRLFNNESKRREAIFDTAGVVVLGVSLWYLVSASGAAYAESSTLEKRWSALANQWQQLFDNRAEISAPDTKARITALIEQQTQIEQSEPSETDHQLLKRSQSEVLHALGYDQWMKDHGTDYRADISPSAYHDTPTKQR